MVVQMSVVLAPYMKNPNMLFGRALCIVFVVPPYIATTLRGLKRLSAESG